MKISDAHRGVKKARVEMLPLIDIVFLVLVVFIYAMLSMAVHRGLPVYLPQSSTSEIDSNSSLTITIPADGTILLNKQRLSLDGLAEELRKHAGDRPQPPVILFADRSIGYERLVTVLDEIRRSGLERVSLQTEALR